MVIATVWVQVPLSPPHFAEGFVWQATIRRRFRMARYSSPKASCGTPYFAEGFVWQATIRRRLRMAGHNSPEVSCGTPQFAKQLVWCSVFRRCLGDFFINGCVAQLVRALRSHRRGRWFESNHIHQKLTRRLAGVFVLFLLLYRRPLARQHAEAADFQSE